MFFLQLSSSARRWARATSSTGSSGCCVERDVRPVIEADGADGRRARGVRGAGRAATSSASSCSRAEARGRRRDIPRLLAPPGPDGMGNAVGQAAPVHPVNSRSSCASLNRRAACVTWNVAGRVGAQPEQAEAIAGVGADVVALQEVTARTEPLWRAALAGAGLRGVRDARSTTRRAESRPRGSAVLTAARGRSSGCRRRRRAVARAGALLRGSAASRSSTCTPRSRPRPSWPRSARTRRSPPIWPRAAARRRACCAGISTRRAASTRTATC